MNISNWLGVNYSLTGDTNLKIGELSDARNMRITSDLKLQKRQGYTTIIDSTENPITAMWSGILDGSERIIAVSDGTIADLDDLSIIGTLTDAPTRIFYFNSKLYFINGADYYSYDGTTYASVDGYIPKIFIGTNANGTNGTAFEEINLLTGKKRQTFNGDNTATVYYIAEQSVTSIDKVYVNGALQVLTTDYTVNLTNGTVTFLVAPSTGQDNVEIYWTKGTGNRTEVLSHTQFLLYGGKNDTRVFLYGNGTNRVVFSDLADTLPSAEYFPVSNFLDVGSDEYEVTSLAKQYDRLIIHKTKGAWYSYYDYDGTLLKANFPIFPLNDTIGNVALGQAQIIRNNPITVYEGVREWLATTVRDERNERNISERVQLLLDTKDLSTALTFDFEREKEYWLCIDKIVFVYNYGNDTWYIHELAHTPTCFMFYDNYLYMGTSDGYIMKWANYQRETIPEYLTDNGTTINSYAWTGFMDYNAPTKRKFLNFGWLSLKPESKSLALIEWQTDNDVSSSAEQAQYSLLDFGNIDFADFTFLINYNPQPFRFKFKAKKFAMIKFKISNNSSTETMTLTELNIPASAGGNVK